MADVRVYRAKGEVLADAGTRADVVKQSVEVAVNALATNTSALLQVMRLKGEVLGFQAAPAEVAVPKQSIEVALGALASNPGANLRLIRLAGEVLASIVQEVSVPKQSIEVAFAALTYNPYASLHLSRIKGEVLADAQATILTPLSDPTGLDFFLHNWADKIEMTTSYVTDIAPAQDSLSEERRAQIGRPFRKVSLHWTQNDETFIDRLLVQLRRFPNERLSIPLYQDQMELTVDSIAADTVFVDTRFIRVFLGQRVAIIKLDPGDRSRISQVDLRRVVGLQDDAIILDAITSFALDMNDTLVFPTIDVEINLEAGIDFITETVGDVSLDLEEVVGPSGLPPTASGKPPGFDEYREQPIFSLTHNWDKPFSTHFVREGLRTARGHGVVIDPRGARHRTISSYEFGPADREDFWDLLQFFDTRRGRCRSFWSIDQENNWTVVGISGGIFIDIDQMGDFTAFQAEMQYIGFVLEDGTRVVREAVTILPVLTTWRITIPEPVTFTPADIRRCARARLVRFMSDELKEAWTTPNAVTSQFEHIEVLEEKDVSLG